jgi:hypothetical protein
MNDTGSSILSLFDTDMQYLGNLQGYTGRAGQVEVRNANGTINNYPQIHVQVQQKSAEFQTGAWTKFKVG